MSTEISPSTHPFNQKILAYLLPFFAAFLTTFFAVIF